MGMGFYSFVLPEITIIAEGENISTVRAGPLDSGYKDFSLDFGPNLLSFKGNFMNVRVQVRIHPTASPEPDCMLHVHFSCAVLFCQSISHMYWSAVIDKHAAIPCANACGLVCCLLLATKQVHQA